MKRNAICGATLLLGLGVFSGCAGSPESEDELVGEAPSAALNANALNANALNANGLYADALNPSMLGAGPLAWDSFGAEVQAVLQDAGPKGGLARQLLKYSVGCALDPSQSIHVTWSDGQSTYDETYGGVLGLSPRWAVEPLDSDDHGWVSACLISRVNYLGVSVTISSRAAPLFTPSSELNAYSHEEGAFWGDVFTDPPSAYACDYVPDDANSRAHDRFCAAGYDVGGGVLAGCGIINRVGSCASACDGLVGGQYHGTCSGGAVASSHVITVFLP